jgi:hypothetical protein
MTCQLCLDAWFSPGCLLRQDYLHDNIIGELATSEQMRYPLEAIILKTELILQNIKI